MTTDVHFKRGRGTRKVMKRSEEPEPQPQSAVPRISRLMALAIRMQELVDRGEVADYAELARLAHVSRARISQITSLTLLAPDIQEAILAWPVRPRFVTTLSDSQSAPESNGGAGSTPGRSASLTGHSSAFGESFRGGAGGGWVRGKTAHSLCLPVVPPENSVRAGTQGVTSNLATGSVEG